MTSLTNRFLSHRNSFVDSSVVDLSTLPTMYDLPSEFPDEPGLPDEFHSLQPQLLSRTLTLRDYAAENRFTGTDINVYYDLEHTGWHKRPDWFLSVDVPRIYDESQKPRRSYVVWQECKAPTVVVEFLSFNTERQDLGRFYRAADKIYNNEPEQNPGGIPKLLTEEERASKTTPPDKFVVYEQYLKVPYYIVYSQHTGRLRYFQHNGQRFEEQPVNVNQTPALWLDDLDIGLGIWDDYFEGLPGPWLRWCDADGNWMLTDTEKERLAKEQAQQTAQQAQETAERLAEKLRSLGIDPSNL
ncbi:MAG: Uma2 family endonuclease [Phormidesmis sp.]